MARSKMNKAGEFPGSMCASMSKDQLKAAIEKKAKEFYEKSGRQPGHDMDNWLQAEKFVYSNICGDYKSMRS